MVPLAYSNSCSSGTMKRHNGVIIYKVENTVLYHWYFHNIHGLTYYPVLQSWTWYPCETTTCSVSRKQWCWLQPRLKDSYVSGNIILWLNTCTSDSNPKLHIVGYFRGAVRFKKGSIKSLGTLNMCKAYMDGANIVEIYSTELCWCDITINNLESGTTVVDPGAGAQNVCSTV